MNYTQQQFDKLPSWAKNEITRLKANEITLRKRLDEFTGETETNTFILEGMDKKPLPKNSHVIFFTGEKQQNNVTVYVRSTGEIDINSHSSKTMAILPRASNSFYISFVD